MSASVMFTEGAPSPAPTAEHGGGALGVTPCKLVRAAEIRSGLPDTTRNQLRLDLNEEITQYGCHFVVESGDGTSLKRT